MHRLRRLPNLVLALGIAATPAAASAQPTVAPPVIAQAPPTNDMVRAAERLRERLAVASASDAPTLTSADGALVRRAFDRDALRAMPLDLRVLAPTCGAIGRTLIAYMQFANRVTGNDREAANRQALKLQDEVSLGLAAGNVCVQRSFRAADALARSSDAARPEQARQGLKDMRHGAAQAIRGSLDAVISTGMSARNRDLVLSAILEDAPTVAASFPQPERNDLRTMVLARVPRVTGADRIKLQAIAKAYGGSACNALCKFASVG